MPCRGDSLESQGKGADQFAKYPSLQDRVVLITGGASGIGEVLVEAFTLQGAKVVFLDTSDEAATALVDRLSPNVAHTPVYFHCDLADIAALSACLVQIIARFGTLDVVINNAGDDTRHKTEDVTPEFWDRCTAVNLKHQFFVSQAVIPGMKWQGPGVILNMSSISWMIPSTSYATSKAAIAGLTRTLAHELNPHGIRVDSIFPGAAEIARQQRKGHLEESSRHQPDEQLTITEEAARLALFLSSDDLPLSAHDSRALNDGWI